MAYNAIAQREHDAFSDDANDSNASGSPPQRTLGLSFQPLSPDFSNMGGSLFKVKTTKPADQTRIATTSAATSYDMLDSEDEEADVTTLHRQRHADAPVPQHMSSTDRQPLGPPQESPSEHSTNKNMATWQSEDEPVIVPRTVSPEPMMRTASSEGSVDLQHPVPDLQSMQGAYVGNVERLERSAERLSMTSDISEELRKLKLEQKRSESRRSSIRGSHYEEGGTSVPLANRKFSSASVSNSIVGVNNAARSGGYSPGGWIGSRGGSIRSGSFSQSTGLRLAQFPGQESDQDGGQLHSSIGTNVPTIPPPVPRHGSFARPDNGSPKKSESDHQAVGSLAEPEITLADPIRPVTSASVDTFQQANQLFTDFDGVHFTPHLQDPSASASGQSGTRRVSISHSLVGRQSFVEPQGDQKMVFYPAPVPALLNLPKKLSKLPPTTQREQRRSQVLDAIPTAARRSAIWLPGLEEASASAEDLTMEERRQSRHMDPRRSMANLAGLPPQLRASAFFDQPAIRQDVQVKEESAVATLDSILDASAHAPVSAFTDHPIVGRVGAEVYGKENNARKSTGNLLAPPGNLKKKSSKDELNQTAKAASRSSFGFFTKRRHSGEEEVDEEDERVDGDKHLLSPGEEERLSEGEDTEEGTGDEEGDDEEDDGPYFGAPTTLLAELQIRKQEQRMRNRTAANAFPNGMHSTLLELDAVAQIQRESRRNKRVALAWEDPNAHGPGSDDEDDDDVPLAVLYANKNNERYDEDRPLGLMEKREMEDNEPLSRRRDRLKGGPDARRGVSPNKRASTMYQLEVPHVSGQNNSVDSGDEEEETLAARIARLKAKGTATGLAEEVSTDFAADLLTKFGGEKQKEDVEKGNERDSPDEETLGQRKKRLQAEREARAKEATSGGQPGLSQLKQRRSLADILQAHPVSGSRQVSGDNSGLGGATDVGGLLHQQQQLQQQRSQQLREQNTFGNTVGLNAPLVNTEDESAGVKNAGAVNGLLYERQQYEAQKIQQLKQQNTLLNTAGVDARLSQYQHPQYQQPQTNLNNRMSFAGGLYNDGSGGMAGGTGMGGYGGYNGGMGMAMGMNAYGSGGPAPMGYPNSAMAFNNQHNMGMGGVGMGMHMNAYAPQSATAAGGMGYGNQGATMMQMGQQMAALDARQREMVERWRQSVMQ